MDTLTRTREGGKIRGDGRIQTWLDHVDYGGGRTPGSTAIIPAVIDMLNVVPSFEHHWRVYGGWSPAINDYLDNDIMKWSGTPRYRELMKVTEPYEYRERYTMPKFIVNAAGDEFFLPDSSQFYWDDLKGEKLIRYVPNTKHSLAQSDARESMLAYYSMILNNKPRPRYNFKFTKDGTIRVETKDEPSEVKVWQATNPEKRDFRLDVIGKAYTSTPLTAKKKGLYDAKVQALRRAGLRSSWS